MPISSTIFNLFRRPDAIPWSSLLVDNRPDYVKIQTLSYGSYIVVKSSRHAVEYEFTVGRDIEETLKNKGIAFADAQLKLEAKRQGQIDALNRYEVKGLQATHTIAKLQGLKTANKEYATVALESSRNEACLDVMEHQNSKMTPLIDKTVALATRRNCIMQRRMELRDQLTQEKRPQPLPTVMHQTNGLAPPPSSTPTPTPIVEEPDDAPILRRKKRSAWFVVCEYRKTDSY